MADIYDEIDMDCEQKRGFWKGFVYGIALTFSVCLLLGIFIP